ncbi:MAG: type IV pilus modification PilV family protein [Acidimicrobiia bacterium]
MRPNPRAPRPFPSSSTSAAPAAERAGRRAECGETLVELMITVAIMGLAMVAILGAIWTTLRIADYNSKTSSADVVLRTFAEALKQPDAANTFHYIPCTVAGAQVAYPQFVPDAPYTNYVATITKIQYLSGYNSSNEPTWVDSCPATDLGLQRIQLKVTGPTTDPAVKGTETVTVVKRDATSDVPVGSA